MTHLPKLTPVAAIDIFVTAVLIYQFLSILRGRRAANVLVGLGVLLALYLAALAANLELLRAVLQTLAPYTPLGLILMFQQEIRRMLARMGQQGWTGFGARLKRREFVEEILLAMDALSKTKTGALIVIEKDIGLRTFVESGVALDAVVSRDILLAVFFPKAALHDGAVIVQNDRIAAAACFLPLSGNPALASTMGTRHRAGIGVTEESDCIALIVSEETGQLSVAVAGEIERDLTLADVDARIAAHLGGKAREAEEGEGDTDPVERLERP